MRICILLSANDIRHWFRLVARAIASSFNKEDELPVSVDIFPRIDHPAIGVIANRVDRIGCVGRPPGASWKAGAPVSRYGARLYSTAKRCRPKWKKRRFS